MALIKGSTAYLFVIGIVLITTGALLYAKSERLAGWENVHRGQVLEHWGLAVFIAGVLCWVLSYVIDKRK